MQFARHGNETVCLALEVIHYHAYEHSRFLRGASLHWGQLDLDDTPVPRAEDLNAQASALRYVQPERGEIHVFDKDVLDKVDCCWSSRQLPASSRSAFERFEAEGQEPEFLSWTFRRRAG